MNSPILNRDFQHPADGWYQIEARGDHPNQRAGVVQIIDDQACDAIVNRFNSEAAQPGFAGMLIDHEHFKHDADKETIAYGWLGKLENRSDGIYGQIRWTETGKKAVDGGDYRFFSTEYDPSDLTVLNRGQNPQRVRPMRLDGLTLTNANNNKGQKPITNRSKFNLHTMKNKDDNTPEQDDEAGPQAVAASKTASDASETADSPREHEQAAILHRKAQKLQTKAGNEQTAAHHGEMADMHDNIADRMRNGCKNREFPPGSAGSEHQQHEQQNTIMKSVLTKLGLAADASEPAVLAEVTRILNRNSELEGQQIESDLETYKNRFDPKQLDFIKSLLVTNRTAMLDFLKAQPETKAPVAPGRIHNRQTAQPVDKNAGAGAPDDADLSAQRTEAIELYKISNRCSFQQANDAVRRKSPELFGLPKRS
jgi:phage I-like protein